MAKESTVRVAWRGGEHDMALGIGEILVLEPTCHAGLAAIFQRLTTGSWGVQDVRETIRLGLIGAGMPDAEALQLIKACVDNHPNGYAPSCIIASKVLEAAIIGVTDDNEFAAAPGKSPAAEASTGQVSSTKTAASAAPQSTDEVTPSATTPEKPTG